MNRIPYYPELRYLRADYGYPFRRKVLSEAFQILGGIPVSQLDLGRFICTGEHETEDDAAHDCGTVACAGGWLALHPKFGPKYNLKAERKRRRCPRSRSVRATKQDV